jgi:hypothetical protein
MSGEAILQMALTSRAMVPQAAEIFGAGARSQRDIENELETLRRERAYVEEKLEKGYDPKLMAEQDRIDAQIRRAELAGMEQEKATRRALGGVAIDYIGAWMGAVGTPEAFAAGQKAIGEAGVQFELWDWAQWKQAEDVMAELQRGGIGQVPWTEAIAGAAGVIADTVTITADTVNLDGPVAIYLPESLFPGVGGAPGQEPGYIVQTSFGEEIATEGIKTRR